MLPPTITPTFPRAMAMQTSGSTWPGGCFPTLPRTTERAFMPPHNCWDPRHIQLPKPDAEIQSIEGAQLLG